MILDNELEVILILGEEDCPGAALSVALNAD